MNLSSADWLVVAALVASCAIMAFWARAERRTQKQAALSAAAARSAPSRAPSAPGETWEERRQPR